MSFGVDPDLAIANQSLEASQLNRHIVGRQSSSIPTREVIDGLGPCARQEAGAVRKVKEGGGVWTTDEALNQRVIRLVILKNDGLSIGRQIGNEARQRV